MTRIALLRPEDAAELVSLHDECFLKGWSLSEMQSHIDEDLALGCWGAGLGDSILGFILVRAFLDQAEILTLAVDPKSRRKGLARALLEGVEENPNFRSVKSLFLEVAEDNFSAIALYKSSGFKAIGRRPAYYKRANGRVAALSLAKRY